MYPLRTQASNNLKNGHAHHFQIYSLVKLVKDILMFILNLSVADV